MGTGSGVLVPLVLPSGLCARVAVLAWEGRMKSVAEDFHHFYQTTPSSERGH